MERGSGILIKIRYLTLLCITILIVTFSFLPNIFAQHIELEKSSQLDQRLINYSDLVEIHISLHYGNGSILTISRNISANKTDKLIKQFLENENNELTFEESLKQKLTILKNLDLTEGEIALRDFLNNTNNDTMSSLGYDFGMASLVNFFGIGLGVGVGINTHIPFFGWEFLGLFAFRGKASVANAFGRSTEVRGFILGGFIGFIGLLIKVLIPYSYGPIIIGFGLTGFTAWIGTRPSLT